MNTKQQLSPYLTKPLRSLDEVLRERRVVEAGKRSGYGRIGEDKLMADNNNAPATRRLGIRSV
ncbi:hypothetical protein HBA54_19325 [Pelagibius litoralis]|uniref:Uncharacterized protein n=1 Tax=Pelagibius litoralis TaxID=374515 RepID=A0A967KEI3_9PROT|nr:hypothetical protein [Pelagibius litoralis]NIA70755.1 hypothetical protein [Pelagibius litoralis]